MQRACDEAEATLGYHKMSSFTMVGSLLFVVKVLDVPHVGRQSQSHVGRTTAVV
jgi:hypothetical protein